MAVYTKINKKDLLYINKKFNDERFLSFKGIKQGIENTNYLLKSKSKKCLQLLISLLPTLEKQQVSI